MLFVNVGKHLLSSLNICLLVWWRTVFLSGGDEFTHMPFGHVLLSLFMRLFGFGCLFRYNNTSVFHVDIAKQGFLRSTVCHFGFLSFWLVLLCHCAQLRPLLFNSFAFGARFSVRTKAINVPTFRLFAV